ncbi:hypothetical protein QBC43DRAFT_203038 [Cladorrhinum sp. PSN259]|nr:hypothetical protein QBC43DRAFT_203038 [Cladorrhinum sp. PSN259]
MAREFAVGCTRKSIENLVMAATTKASKERRLFLTSLKNFANVPNTPAEAPDLENTKTPPKSGHDEYLRSLYLALRQLRCCADSKQRCFRANISIDLGSTDKVSNGVMLDVFFLHHDGLDVKSHWEKHWEWKETQIIQSFDHYSSAKAQKVTGPYFCKLISSKGLARLKFYATETGIYEVGYEKLSEERISLKSPSVSLTTVLPAFSNTKSDDLQRKLLLSYLLARAVWQFYDTDWIAEDWTKETVHFMAQRLDRFTRNISTARTGGTTHPKLYHRPFLLAQLQASANSLGAASNLDATTQIHIFPKIMALGIVLLEIEIGQPIEQYISYDHLDEDGNPRDNSRYFAGVEFITSAEWSNRRSTPKAVKQAIETCLGPDMTKLGHDPASVRDRLYEHVVGSLRNLFSIMWTSPDNFDPGPMEFDGDSTSFAIPESLPSSHPTNNNQRFLSNNMTFDSSDNVIGLDLGGRTELFGDESKDHFDKERFDQATKWMKSFQKMCIRANIKSSSVLKVAILDTGADSLHPRFKESDRIKDYKSFINDGDAGKDASGHGTHVAGILLSLAPNVDLYIAQVTDSRLRRNRNEIFKALEYARKEWKIDMISMSFGYRNPGASDQIKKEIERCLNDGIIVFASASNDGGNGSRTYPAKYDRVLCVHSATGQGERSGFNPTPESGESNYAVLGECINSSWPLQHPLSGDRNSRVMSGTSFATPVAVAIAAFMVGYIEKKLSNYGWNVDPRSPEGMQKIFRLMAVQRDNYDWISPDLFFERDPDDIRVLLKTNLGGYLKATATA